jgi:cell wall-associated NlpC family hydrolase
LWLSAIRSLFSSRPSNQFEGNAPGRFILDPENVGIPGNPTWDPQNVPRRVRENFGYVPDEAQLRPGDLLLVCPKNQDAVSNGIRNVQLEAGQHKRDACWCHVGIYLGAQEAAICEATLAGVQVGELYDYLPGDDVPANWLRFRRDPDMSPEDRWRLCVHALKMIGEPYDVGAAYRLFVQSGNRKYFWRSHRSHAGIAVICSQLYRNAFQHVTGRLPVAKNVNIVLPAELSATPLLQDVPVNWVKL